MIEKLGEVLLGVLLGALAVACFSYPQVGRAIGKVVAVIGIALGAGLIAWGFSCVMADDFAPMHSGPVYIMSVSQVFGWGIGLLAGGITALVLSLVGRDLN
jgi:hypothetical protein